MPVPRKSWAIIASAPVVSAMEVAAAHAGIGAEHAVEHDVQRQYAEVDEQRHERFLHRVVRLVQKVEHGGREQADAGRQVRPDRRGRLRGLSRREPAAASDDHGGDDPQIQKVIGITDK